jgi:hypothetical protein
MSNHDNGAYIRTLFCWVHNAASRARSAGGYFILILDGIDEAIHRRATKSISNSFSNYSHDEDVKTRSMNIGRNGDGNGNGNGGREDDLDNYDTNLLHILLYELRNNFSNLCVILTANLLINDVDPSLLDR